MIEGPRDPWRPTKHGPMREVILTANLEWFETGGDSDVLFDTVGQESRQRKFEALAVAWLKETFGDDVVHARADLDETTYHIHAVILPRAAEETAHATFHKLQPSVHPLINDYEAAQDSVGAWFTSVGLVRGEKRAEKVRKAYAANTPLPPIRRHKRTRAWRGEQERKLAEDKAKLEAERKGWSCGKPRPVIGTPPQVRAKPLWPGARGRSTCVRRLSRTAKRRPTRS